MSPQVLLALGVVVATMVIAVAGTALRARARTTETEGWVLPRWALLTVLALGVLVLLALLVGFALLAT